MVDSLLILGIDPGLAHTGWGVIETMGSKKSCIAYGCIATTPDEELPLRLRRIYAGIDAAIESYHPVELGIESVYFGANTKSAIATGEARGVALVATANRGLAVGEYTPLQIKQAVTGVGAADKDQVQFMVRAILALDHDPKPDHCSDALAAAIAHANYRGANRIAHLVEERAR